MDNVRMQIVGNIAEITLNRPEAMNALNNPTYEELVACLRQIEAQDDVRVVILTGAGDKAFAAGADIAQMLQQNAAEGRAFSLLCNEAGLLLENMRQVTIAAVNGYALGGGCELALACDLRIAGEQAKFALPEVKLGIIPGGGGTQRLARIVGIGRAKEMIFTGMQIDAAEAFRIGLANHVVPQEDLMETCRTLAMGIADNAGYAVAMAKASINTSQSADLTTGIGREADLLGLVFATEDKREGMKAFLEGRPPQFTDF